MANMLNSRNHISKRQATVQLLDGRDVMIEGTLFKWNGSVGHPRTDGIVKWKVIDAAGRQAVVSILEKDGLLDEVHTVGDWLPWDDAAPVAV